MKEVVKTSAKVTAHDKLVVVFKIGPREREQRDDVRVPVLFYTIIPVYLTHHSITAGFWNGASLRQEYIVLKVSLFRFFEKR